MGGSLAAKKDCPQNEKMNRWSKFRIKILEQIIWDMSGHAKEESYQYPLWIWWDLGAREALAFSAQSCIVLMLWLKSEAWHFKIS